MRETSKYITIYVRIEREAQREREREREIISRLQMRRTGVQIDIAITRDLLRL